MQGLQNDPVLWDYEDCFSDNLISYQTKYIIFGSCLLVPPVVQSFRNNSNCTSCIITRTAHTDGRRWEYYQWRGTLPLGFIYISDWQKESERKEHSTLKEWCLKRFVLTQGINLNKAHNPMAMKQAVANRLLGAVSVLPTLMYVVSICSSQWMMKTQSSRHSMPSGVITDFQGSPFLSQLPLKSTKDRWTNPLKGFLWRLQWKISWYMYMVKIKQMMTVSYDKYWTEQGSRTEVQP